MFDITLSQRNLIEYIIGKFPDFSTLAEQLNSIDINWGIAAGAACSFYAGDKDFDDVDIWVKNEDREKVAKLMNKQWVGHSSPRHRAVNIELGGLDLFTECIKLKEDKQLINYRWTDLVNEKLRVVEIDGVIYKIVSPEDVAILKGAYPWNDVETNQVRSLFVNKSADEEYLHKRLTECSATDDVYLSLNTILKTNIKQPGSPPSRG